MPQNGDRDFVPNKVVILTDGKSTLGQENLANEIFRLKQKTDGIFVVGVGESCLLLCASSRIFPDFLGFFVIRLNYLLRENLKCNV